MKQKMILALLLLMGAMATVRAQDDMTLKLYQEKIKGLEDSLEQYKALYEQSRTDIKNLTVQLGEKESIDSQRQQLEALQQGIAKLEERIYKTAYLYPTEVAYDSELIKRSAAIANAYESVFEKNSLKLSDQYQLQRSTYKPLLEKYPTYTTELETFMNNQLLKTLMANGGSIPKGEQAHLQGALQNTTYFKECFVKKNKPPYPSLPYLDKFVDKALALIKKSGNVENEARSLLHSLRPNAPVEGESVAADFQQLEGTICQLLRYPLEVAYDNKLIQRTRAIAQQYEQTVPIKTERFAKQKAECEQLYDKYDTYTNELIDFMNKEVRPLVKTGEGKVPHTQAAPLKAKLQATAYSKECYGKTANIPFLDTFVKNVFSLIDSQDNVEKKLKELTQSLHPND